MKKNLFYALLTACLLFTGPILKAQVYSDWGLSPSGSIYDTITKVSDTLRFQFSNLPTIGYGQVKLTVFFEGDFNSQFEWATVYYAGDSSNSNGPYDSLGQAGPAGNPNSCGPEDSTDFSFSIDTINGHAPNLAIIVIPNSQVGTQCTRNRARVRIEYTYCSFGAPVEFASLILSDSLLCPLDGLLPLSGTPAGGTYSGIGTSGSNFDPYGLAFGNYTITYTAADSIGCISSTTAVISIDNSPNIADINSCPGIPITLNGSNSNIVWYSDAALSNPLDTGISFITPPLYHSTSYYAAFACSDMYFRLDTLLADSINIVDNNAAVGDDRGGIAVTPKYVYYIADNGAIRYDADMTNPLSPLGTRDGLFSDLSSGDLYSLWNSTTNTEPQTNSTNYTVNAIRTLNDDLTFGTGITQLSQPINLGNANYPTNGIFAGAGKLGLYSGITRHFYVVNLCNGVVTDLGFNASPKLRTCESWSMWGVLEYDGTEYSVVYRDSVDNDIHRTQLSSGTTTSIGTFPTGITDMASITYNPWNKNWYFHYEGVSAALGGTTETTGYANASDSMSILPGGTLSCAEEVKVSISNASIGNDTTLCEQNYILFAGVGYSNYIWNGDSSNFNSYTATGTDTVVFQGLYSDGCNHLDTVIVTMNDYPVVNLGTDITICGDSVILDAGNSGSGYLWSDASTNQTLTATSTGTYDVTVTNGSGCSSSDNIKVTINNNPVVTLALNPVLVCINWTPYALTGGSPANGTYSGTAVSNGTFIPSFAGVGTYSITYSYTDSNGCSGSSSQNIVVDACTGIQDISGNTIISVNPNPGNGVFTLAFISSNPEKVTIEIADVSGKIVYQEVESHVTGQQKKMDLSYLSEGIYILKIYADEKMQVIKLVVEK